MRRRVFLASGAGAVVSVSALAGCAHAAPPPAPSPSPAPSGGPVSPNDLDGAVARLRAQYVGQFDGDYVDNVVLPSFLNSIYDGQRPVLPMIDVALTKENALPYDMWGLLSQSWKPAPEDGVTVFLQGLDKRGPDNRRKRIYMSAVTPDLYQGMYQAKIVGFWNQLFSPANANKPLMRIYLDTFWDLYWDLHLGVSGKDLPDQVRQIGAAFNTVLAYRDPTQKIVYDNYLTVRKNLDFLKSWIADRLTDVQSGRTPNAEKTFAWYWLKNAGDGQFFDRKDVVFECFHNFVAFSQWGNTLYNVMAKLGQQDGDAQTKDWFAKTMAGGKRRRPRRLGVPAAGTLRDGTVPHHLTQCRQHLRALRNQCAGLRTPRLHRQPAHFYQPRPRAVAQPRGLRPEPVCPRAHQRRHRPSADPADGPGPMSVPTNVVRRHRRSQGGLAQQRFGTVFAAADNRPLPVCDYAGFAPFGFGYRRCPGEQLTIMAFEDFIRKTASERLEFVKLPGANPEKVPLGSSTHEAVPIGPTTVINDDIGFTRPA